MAIITAGSARTVRLTAEAGLAFRLRSALGAGRRLALGEGFDESEDLAGKLVGNAVLVLLANALKHTVPFALQASCPHMF
eukprot:568522-Pleurochrysis_carterae.AAC.2